MSLSTRLVVAAIAAVSVALACNGDRGPGMTAGDGNVLLADTARPPIPARPDTLRVCADPDNMPFSNRHGDGFENVIATIVAQDLGLPLVYSWWPQQRGFFRNGLGAGVCDLVVGVPSALDAVATTPPYYRSTYVFVYRRDRALHIRSLDDTVLRRLRIGVQLAGDDGANPPPAHALAARGLSDRLVGYPLQSDHVVSASSSRIIDALYAGAIDVAIVWGPLGGYAAHRAPARLVSVPVSPEIDLPFLPFVFDIAMGARHADTAFLGEVGRAIRRRRVQIDSVLDRYGIPRVRAEGSP